jgi:hypothetical protein
MADRLCRIGWLGQRISRAVAGVVTAPHCRQGGIVLSPHWPLALQPLNARPPNKAPHGPPPKRDISR